MSNCNHDVIAWRDEHGEARLWGCYHCKVKFVPMTQLVDEVLEEREACADIAENWNCNGSPRLGVAAQIRARGRDA